MKKILNKKLDEKAMLAGIFAFASLGVLYLFVSANVNNTQAPTIDLSRIVPTTKQTQNTETTTNGMKKYRSNKLKIEFDYPSSYKINEKPTSLALSKSQGKNDTLDIVRYASNFDSVKEHIDNLVKRWNKLPEDREPFNTAYLSGEVIHGMDGEVEYSIVFFEKNYYIYQLETSNPSLFPDLEVIAKSFKILE